MVLPQTETIFYVLLLLLTLATRPLINDLLDGITALQVVSLLMIASYREINTKADSKTSSRICQYYRNGNQNGSTQADVT